MARTRYTPQQLRAIFASYARRGLIDDYYGVGRMIASKRVFKRRLGQARANRRNKTRPIKSVLREMDNSFDEFGFLFPSRIEANKFEA